MSDTATQTAGPQPTAQPVSSLAMIRTLAGIALISGLLLALVYQGTYDIIKRNKEEAIRSAVFEVIPDAESQRMFQLTESGDLVSVEGEPQPGLPQIIAGYDSSGNLAGVALQASNNQGYGGEITVIYGYDPASQKLTGLKVLESKETPGLGDRIGKQPFLGNFEGLDVTMDNGALVHPVTLVKSGEKTEPWQIDAISGATISSKAVTSMVKDSTENMLPVVGGQLSTLKGE